MVVSLPLSLFALIFSSGEASTHSAISGVTSNLVKSGVVAVGGVWTARLSAFLTKLQT